jgi:predicted nucleic acid-binding Zn ribbon protein
MNIKRTCAVCGNPTHDYKKWYCSLKCRRKMKKVKRLNRLYFNDRTRRWELLNANSRTVNNGV